MQAPPQVREDRRDVLSRAMGDIQFGALVVSAGGDFTVSHLPMLVRDDGAGPIVLEGHVSRSNDIWSAGDGASALAIFQGPQAYVHPGWYPTKKRDPRAVPTWNYIAVYAHGRLEAISDPAWLLSHLEALTTRNEASREEPWAIDDAPADFIEGMVRGIVGLRFAVERIEGSWKMGQKHPLENRLGAAAGLAASPKPADREVGAIMESLAKQGAG